MIDVGIIESPSLPQPRSFSGRGRDRFRRRHGPYGQHPSKVSHRPAAYVYGACITLRSFQPVKARLTFDVRRRQPRRFSACLGVQRGDHGRRHQNSSGRAAGRRLFRCLPGRVAAEIATDRQAAARVSRPPHRRSTCQDDPLRQTCKSKPKRHAPSGSTAK